MPIMRAPGAGRRSAAVRAEAAARTAKQAAAKTELPAMDAFLSIATPTPPQTAAQLKAITRAVESLTRGTVGG